MSRTKKNNSPESSEDIIDVLDEQGNKTGEVLPRKEIHRLGKIHRAIHLYLFDKSSNKLLIQRRSSSVDHFPNMLSISVMGHVNTGEESIQAVKRELKEELSIDPNQVKMDFLFSIRQDNVLAPSYIDRQFNDVYLGWATFKAEEIQFDPNEVSEVKLMHFSEFEHMVLKKNQELAYVYIEECKRILPYLNL
ncbi:MAG: NUDIX domain-containing protein [Candidatus Cardinium sp.]|uniref:NUDIX hydrolase n=1 Tax=Cardinium endosymbiont of Dermatophagoides farinae TaxID=2597823 RepID=UPI0011821AAF|nr:NUDIX domain-containing protein [Cardinium endosymbiont of Dermatophagoides farinae]TSJ81265.1 NUDIX domain-containing protein [Cardinium endosymbiont of Dermatophagoides farinae]UWW97323.1 MAG: NUDIX domain-containing protein [Candidatus Cardinium sp.]